MNDQDHLKSSFGATKNLPQPSGAQTSGRTISPVKIIIAWLTEPVISPPEGHHRQARFLAWILCALLLSAFIAFWVAVRDNPAGTPLRLSYTALIAVVFVLLLVAFLFNRYGRYQIAAGLTVLCGVLGPWGSALLDQSVLRENYVPLIYTVMAVFLSSILLSAITTTLLALSQLLILIYFSLFFPATRAINWPSLLIFLLMMYSMSILINILRQQDQQQIDLQTRQLAESETRLREQSIRDPLTGLYNRRSLDETFDREILQAARLQTGLGVLMIDIDNLKKINDRYGHEAGDLVLCRLSQNLQQETRRSDIAYRLGGDEFLLILPESTLVATLAIANRLLEETRRMQIEQDGQILVPVSLSIGAAIFPEHGESSSALIRAADQALYHAKRLGRNRVAVINEPSAA